jgi:hypothetical protein
LDSLECVPKKALEPQKGLRFERADSPSAEVTEIADMPKANRSARIQLPRVSLRAIDRDQRPAIPRSSRLRYSSTSSTVLRSHEARHTHCCSAGVRLPPRGPGARDRTSLAQLMRRSAEKKSSTRIAIRIFISISFAGESRIASSHSLKWIDPFVASIKFAVKKAGANTAAYKSPG